MNNPILIHVNRRFHIPLDKIIAVKKKKHGSVYVYFNDGKSERPKIAVAKMELSNLLTVINTARIMSGQKPLLAIKE